ncbi:hypothetical protein QR98_0009700 [Sarcoptes scabiei]|uniref:Uncharacterized protein n=1 Tax=Sarcoptes scabiei TaxID=52283 RepID=A0A131ZW94_SARSC|nr:hypothetical protein QR98_0009700 [Sarcoptes scabiei]
MINQNLPALKVIDLSDCHLITDSGIASLIGTKFDKLIELDLSGCSRITDDCLKIIRRCQSLEKLSISNCP